MPYSSVSPLGAHWLALFPLLPLVILVLVFWTIFWKGLALWHSARRGEPWWFFFMLVVNTLGILEIIYLFGVAKVKSDELFGKKK
jgi:hypothetical protein